MEGRILLPFWAHTPFIPTHFQGDFQGNKKSKTPAECVKMPASNGRENLTQKLQCRLNLTEAAQVLLDPRLTRLPFASCRKAGRRLSLKGLPNGVMDVPEVGWKLSFHFTLLHFGQSSAAAKCEIMSRPPPHHHQRGICRGRKTCPLLS